jgi:hypothetical protein
MTGLSDVWGIARLHQLMLLVAPGTGHISLGGKARLLHLLGLSCNLLFLDHLHGGGLVARLCSLDGIMCGGTSMGLWTAAQKHLLVRLIVSVVGKSRSPVVRLPGHAGGRANCKPHCLLLVAQWVSDM